MISRHYSRWVSPFGIPRIKGYLLLPVDYRSWPRPSSPTDAKTSTICPYFLDPFTLGLTVVKEQTPTRRGILKFKILKSRPAKFFNDTKCLTSFLYIMLLRKEVIQPQVPLRLPCYDFTPITGHTFGSCLPCGLARLLRVQQTFVV
jgi:hypothetical protein